MREPRRRKAATVVVNATIATLLLLGLACSRNPADPDNARLKAIRNDPAFALVPPGGSLLRQFSQEARRAPLSKTYLGPRVQRLYQVSGDLAEVRRFYAERLPSLGWQFWKSVPLSMGEDVLVGKNFGSWEAKLTLHIVDSRQELTVLIEAPPTKSLAD